MPFFTFLFTTQLGKYISVILAVMALFAFVKIGIWEHDRNVRAEATAEFNKKQMEIIQKSQEQALEIQRKIADDQKIIIQQNNSNNDKTDKITDDIKQTLDKIPVPTQSQPVSPVLKETFKNLQKYHE